MKWKLEKYCRNLYYVKIRIDKWVTIARVFMIHYPKLGEVKLYVIDEESNTIDIMHEVLKYNKVSSDDVLTTLRKMENNSYG